MYYTALFPKSSPPVHRILSFHPSNSHRLFNKSRALSSSSSKSSSSSPAGTFGRSSSDQDDKFDSFLKWASSTALVIGSSLAYIYCWSSSPPSSSSSFFPNAWLSFSDSQKEKNEHQSSLPEDSGNTKQPKYIFGDAYRRRIFFNYEKRIRMQSPPEKVFEYFASQRTPDGEVLMTPADLMRAVVPVFPPSESNRVREGNLQGERGPGELHCAPSKFFMLFDTNNDGFISFPEYIFFVTLLSIPESRFSIAFKMFDLDNNGAIDRDEFKKVMALMRALNRQGASHRDGLRKGFRVAESVENGGLLEYFFGADGKGCLKHQKFVQFLRDLQDEILRLEFSHYDFKQRGTISARDFAMSLVASADVSHIHKFLDRADELNREPQLRGISITFEEFKDFAHLRKQLQSLSIAIFSFGKVNGLLTKKDFQRAAAQVCGISLTDNVVNIIFHVFDTNRDGSLSSDEFVKVLQGRERDISQPREAGLMGLISCWLSCTKCSSANFFL